jgi:serine/threonine protein phosphatase PrpC
VCDGHGSLGHLVSSFLKTTLVKKMEHALERDVECEDDEFIKNCLNLVFLQTSKALLESSIDCTFSGSTCVFLLIIKNKVWSANLGDSRAISARGLKEGLKEEEGKEEGKDEGKIVEK